MILEELFCLIDDFCKEFIPQWQAELIDRGLAKKTWLCQMSASELMTILVLFHQQQYRNFKTFYIGHVAMYMKQAFPLLLSYSRFVEQMKRIIMPLFFLLMSFPKAKTGIYFVDSATIKVCHIKREKQHKVFKGLAKKKANPAWDGSLGLSSTF